MEKNKLQNVALNQIHIQDDFWNKYVNLVDDVIIPFQWELINDNELRRAIVSVTSVLPMARSKENTREWYFKIPMWQNGWKQ